MINIPVSIGELIDKITILEIKTEHIKNPDALKNITFELEELSKLSENFKCEELKIALKKVNQTLWNTEDAVRQCERNSCFGEEFIDLARVVYHKNDERARIKRSINDKFNSSIIEEKSYAAY